MSFYVYGIIDPTELPDRTTSLAEQLAAVIYVGKGTRLRSEDHANEARRLLENEANEGTGTADYGRKLNRLIDLYRAGTPPQSVKLSAGFADEGDAYKVEAFAIEAINALRLAHGRAPLTNAIKGHGVAIEPLPQYEARMNTSRVEVADRHGAGQLAILVTADLDDSSNAEYELGDPAYLPAELQGLDGRVNWMVRTDDLPARRAWDVHMPWSDEEARERARRFWRLGADNVRRWITNPDEAPTHLLLGVKESQRSPTTIRYAWRIDPRGKWEYYPGARIGVPLLQADDHHPLVNTIPVIDDQGAMLGNAGGHKLIRYRD